MVKRHFTGFALLIFLLGASNFVLAQPPGTAESIEAAYQKRITKEYLNRVYIPKDLADAFVVLNDLTEEESRRKLLSLPAEEAADRLHFGLGRWMMVNWSFYSGSRFSHYLKSIGLTYPDDMAKFVIITYHRYLSKEPLEVKALVEILHINRRYRLAPFL